MGKPRINYAALRAGDVIGTADTLAGRTKIAENKNINFTRK